MGRPLWLLILGEWLCVELVGLVSPFALFFSIWHVHCRRRRNVTTASAAVSAAVLLLCCCCGVPVVVLTVVVVLLSRLCKDEALFRTQQARYAVVVVSVILCCG